MGCYFASGGVEIAIMAIAFSIQALRLFQVAIIDDDLANGAYLAPQFRTCFLKCSEYTAQGSQNDHINVMVFDDELVDILLAEFAQMGHLVFLGLAFSLHQK